MISACKLILLGEYPDLLVLMAFLFFSLGKPVDSFAGPLL